MFKDPQAASGLERWFFSSPWNRWVLYAALFSLALLVRICCFTGLIGSDDLEYSYYAQSLARGISHPGMDFVGLRWGLEAPVAVAYFLFGVSEWSTTLIPLVASAASVSLITALGAEMLGLRAGLLAGFFLLTFPLHIRYASILVPEPLLEFLALAAVWCYFHALIRDRLRFAFLAGLIFGFAYLAKEVALFIALAFLLDSTLRKKWKTTLALIAGIVAVGAAEVTYFGVTTGDPLLRSHAIAYSQRRYAATHTEDYAGYRLWKDYPRQMLRPDVNFGVHSLVAIALAAAGLFLLPSASGPTVGRKPTSARDPLVAFRSHSLSNPAPPVRTLVLWSLVPFLYLTLGTVDLRHFLPLPGAPRYIGIVYPSLFLLAGVVVSRLLSGPAWLRLSGVLGLIAIGAVGISCAAVKREADYRTQDVAHLRSIVRRARRDHLAVAAIEGNDAMRWSCALFILDTSFQDTRKCAGDCLVVRPDASGLPVAVADRSAEKTRLLPCDRWWFESSVP